MGNRAEEVDPIGDPGCGRAVAKPVEQLAAARDQQVGRRVAPRASERVDRDVEALEVVGAVEGGDERERRRALRNLEPFAKAALGGARRELVDVDPVWHLHDLLGRPLGDSPEVGD